VIWLAAISIHYKTGISIHYKAAILLRCKAAISTRYNAVIPTAVEGSHDTGRDSHYGHSVQEILRLRSG